jgi:hypothetical protein
MLAQRLQQARQIGGCDIRKRRKEIGFRPRAIEERKYRVDDEARVIAGKQDRTFIRADRNPFVRVDANQTQRKSQIRTGRRQLTRPQCRRWDVCGNA